MLLGRLSAILLTLIAVCSVVPAGQLPRLRASSDSRTEVRSPRKYVEGELLVKFRSELNADARNAVHATVRASVAKRFQTVSTLELVRLPKGTSMANAIRRYRSDPTVLYAEPNFVIQALGEPNDPIYPAQWHLKNTAQLGGIAGSDIRAAQAWQFGAGSKNVVVMTIDSGLDYTHPDIVANLFRNTGDCDANGVDDDGDGYVDDCHGINAVAHTSDPMDDNGHGTHVAGIIGAEGNNALGVVGVNWNVQIVPCKFLNEYGNGDVAGAVECLNYARMLKERGVNVVATNNSWGGTEFSQALVDAIDEQRQAGILFIAAAGNDFSDNDLHPVYPANISLPNVISVAATTNSDRPALFSNTGYRTVALAAPGQEILSIWPSSNYAWLSGTSMAAPVVTGVAALVAAQNPSYTWKEIKNVMLAGGASLPELQATTTTGRRVDAYGALTCSGTPIAKRLRPVPDSNVGAVGSPLFISYLNINCAEPGGPFKAQVSTGETISLTDDGMGADVSAGDGVYSGSWIPKQKGSYTISLPDGDSFSVQVLTAYNAVADLFSYRLIGGTSLNLSDDSVATVTSPFPIPFGEGSFTQLYVSSDGTISLTDRFQSFYNRHLPLMGDPIVGRYWNSAAVTLLAPFWDDLYPVAGSDQNVFWEVTGSAPNRELVIEWRNVPFFDCRMDPGKAVTFQVVFHEANSNVLFQYQNLESGCKGDYFNHDFGGTGTVGLQSAPDVGTTWSFSDTGYQPGTLASYSAVRWQLVTAPLNDNPVPAITNLTPNSATSDSADIDITIEGTNFIPGSYAVWDVSFTTGPAKLRTTYVSPTQLRATLTKLMLNGSFAGRHQITVVNPAPGGGQSNAAPFGVGIAAAAITSISPTSTIAGSGAFILTVHGIGFGTG